MIYLWHYKLMFLWGWWWVWPWKFTRPWVKRWQGFLLLKWCSVIFYTHSCTCKLPCLLWPQLTHLLLYFTNNICNVYLKLAMLKCFQFQIMMDQIVNYTLWNCHYKCIDQGDPILIKYWLYEVNITLISNRY